MREIIVHTARGQNIKCQHLKFENPCSALNIVWRTGIGTPSLRSQPPAGKIPRSGERFRFGKFMELMSTPNRATQEFYIYMEDIRIEKNLKN